MEERVVKQGEFYKHFKNKLYQITAIATHSETREKMVVYQAMYGDFQVYVRPYAMFVSEVDHVKYPEVKQKYRFAKYDVTANLFIDEDNQVITVSKNNETPVLSTISKVLEEKSNAIVENTSQTVSMEAESEEGQVSPLLLDCNTFEEKLDKFVMMKNRVDHRLLNDIAVSLDITVENDDLKAKYEEIKACLVTFVHFEDNRMR
jgi:hypothetical protein